MGMFQTFYLTYFSSPAENRPVYQAVRKIRPNVIVELGIQRGIRTANLLQLATSYRDAATVQYFCVDPFEGRSVQDGPGLSLRKAHKMLTGFGAKVKEVPFDAEEGLRHLAKSVSAVDLLIVATPDLEKFLKDSSSLIGSILAENGIAFLGESTPDGKHFPFRQVAAREFRTNSRPLQKAG